MPDTETKYVSKVIYGGKTLVDLTADTITAGKLLTGFTAHDKSGAPITGTCAFDVDSTDADATVAEILTGKTAYARGAKLTGTMPDNGSYNDVITDKNYGITIPQGYHDGSGGIRISDTEAAKLIPTNIREGIEILGVTGTMSGTESVQAQARTVTPGTAQQVIVPDEGYNYLSQVTVEAIPYNEMVNSAGGLTVTIGAAVAEAG